MTAAMYALRCALRNAGIDPGKAVLVLPTEDWRKFNAALLKEASRPEIDYTGDQETAVATIVHGIKVAPGPFML